MKNGRRRGKQRYKCSHCGKNKDSKSRKNRIVQSLWKQYVWGRQTVPQLARTHRRSPRWIGQQLDKASVQHTYLFPQPIVRVADVTFWGRGYGVIVFRSQDLKQNLYWSEVATETAQVYREGKDILEELGFTFDAVVIDGKRGIKEIFGNIPVQLSAGSTRSPSLTGILPADPSFQPGKHCEPLR